ncbi:MAG: hypothetical protein QP950_10030 [Staphylococcus warneri]|uniref:hypothetical protein n=1 Tax=Staphylococcus warneri TaxID=1292 RepID=UPI0005DB2BD5|nr:hypothetical protein [Staphylococcus warneri]MCM3483601.1 hypothetical protein [Staphylococcus warneri]MCR4501736.1 hypothetical protein [Staphylococcus warneri]MCT1633370.1 hypothetical protein [Staphylococcus warneri]MCT2349408.1 hypothetical protein [Staphylococcus warneri]MCV7477354.1 hypothetical protein [Staphylococcus warneri]
MKLYILLSILATAIGTLYAMNIDFLHGLAITFLIQVLSIPVANQFEYKGDNQDE